jgi:hypothetical protein
MPVEKTADTKVAGRKTKVTTAIVFIESVSCLLIRLYKDSCETLKNLLRHLHISEVQL